MKYFKHIALILFLGSFTLFSCKKYPEDHKFMEFTSPENRLEGNWLLTKYLVNNIDSTATLYNNYDGYNYIGTPTPSPQYGNLIMEVGTSENKFHQHPLNMYSIGGTGTIRFEEHKRALEIDFTVTGYKYYPAVTVDSVVVYNLFISNSNWDVKELTKTNLKISNTINHTNYSIEFTKQKD
jgi:hypothetical protein